MCNRKISAVDMGKRTKCQMFGYVCWMNVVLCGLLDDHAEEADNAGIG